MATLVFRREKQYIYAYFENFKFFLFKTGYYEGYFDTVYISFVKNA